MDDAAQCDIYQRLELSAFNCVKFKMSLQIMRRVRNKRCNIPIRESNITYGKKKRITRTCFKPLVGNASGIVYLHVLTTAGMWREKAEEEMSEMMTIFSPFRHRHPDRRVQNEHSIHLQQLAL